MAERVFIARISPARDGGYEVWIREGRYRGVDTDAALSRWDRKRVGGSWSSEHFVGSKRWLGGAERLARRAVNQAQRAAVRCDRQTAKHRARMAQPTHTITAAARAAQPDAGGAS